MMLVPAIGSLDDRYPGMSSKWRGTPLLLGAALLSAGGGWFAVAASQGSSRILTGIALAVLAVIAATDAGRCWSLYMFCVFASGLTLTVGPAVVRPEFLASPLLLACLYHHRTSVVHVGDLRLRLIAPISVGYVLIAVLSAVANAPHPVRSIWIVVQVAAGLGAYLVLKFKDVVKVDLIRRATTVLSCICCLSLVTYIARSFGITDSTLGVAPDGRLIGFSFETNIFATECVAWLACMYSWRRTLSVRTLWLSAPIAVAVLLAGTRAAWLAGLLLLGYMILKKRSLPLLLCVVIAAVAVLTVSTQLAPDRATTGVQSGLSYRAAHPLETRSGTAAYRLDIYKHAVVDMRKNGNWLIGSGMNSFSQFHEIDSTGVGAAYLSTIWLSTPYDVGLLGSLLFMALMLGVWKAVRPASSGGVVLLVLLICATTTNVFWFAFPWIFMALLPGRDSPDPHGVGLARHAATASPEVPREQLTASRLRGAKIAVRSVDGKAGLFVRRHV